MVEIDGLYFEYERTQGDVDRVKELSKIGYVNMTSAEKAEWDGDLKGSLNFSDLIRLETDIAAIAQRYGLSYTPKTDWTFGDILYQETAETYAEWVVRLYDQGHYDDTPNPHTSVIDFRSWQAWNRAEKILADAWTSAPVGEVNFVNCYYPENGSSATDISFSYTCGSDNSTLLLFVETRPGTISVPGWTLLQEVHHVDPSWPNVTQTLALYRLDHRGGGTVTGHILLPSGYSTRYRILEFENVHNITISDVQENKQAGVYYQGTMAQSIGFHARTTPYQIYATCQIRTSWVYYVPYYANSGGNLNGEFTSADKAQMTYIPPLSSKSVTQICIDGRTRPTNVIIGLQNVSTDGLASGFAVKIS